MITPLANDYVLVEHPTLHTKARVPFAMWLKETDAAIRLRSAALAEGRKPTTPHERFAAIWLQANGLVNQTKIDGYLQRRALLDAPPDYPKSVWCAKCGRPLSDKISVALGVGPECRKDKAQ